MRYSSGKLDRTTLPRIPGRLVPRPELLSRLDALTPLIELRGLSGIGKTTLAIQWANHRRAEGDTVMWFNPGDAPQPRELLEAVDQQLPGNSGHRTIVIVDDAHFLTGPDLIEGLCDRLVARSDLHLLICTRHSHPIKRHARTRRIESTLLTGGHLNATRASLSEFAKAWGHSLTAAQNDQLWNNIGGWLAPTRIALEMTPPADSVDLVGAHSYFKEQVLPEIADRASLLVAMTLALPRCVCLEMAQKILIASPHTPDLVTASTPESVLEHFVDHGLLESVSAIGTEERWQLPVLVRRVLRTMFESEYPEKAAQTHRVLGRWLFNRGGAHRVGDMIAHARAAEDWMLLARAWAHHALLLTGKHPQETVRAYSDIPGAALEEFPKLRAATPVIAAMRARLASKEHARPIANYDLAGWGWKGPKRKAAQPTAMNTQDAASRIIAWRARGRFERALEIAETHSERLLLESPVITPQDRAWFEFQWGLSAVSALRGLQATQLFERAIESAENGNLDFLVAAASYQLSLIHTLSGDTGAARQHLGVARRMRTVGHWMHDVIAVAGRLAESVFALDRLERDTDAIEPAGVDADRVEEWAMLTWVRTQHALFFGDPVTMMDRVFRVAALHEGAIQPGGMDELLVKRSLAELQVALGELTRAQLLIVDAGDELLLLKARILYIAGNYTEALAMASSAIWDARTMLRDRVELLLIEAAASLAMGDRATAMTAFERGLLLARDIGTLSPFASMPRPALIRLAGMVEGSFTAAEYELITSIRAPYPETGELVTLTGRELTVLQAMNEHATLVEIARSLTVSVNTVKKQAVAVYAKLGVHDRASALLKARRLGLLTTQKTRSAGIAARRAARKPS
ncbi:MAG TPA: LuxR C-terminal-related transcriptional regulator [Candidatus Agrococcus pullicola]|uniref:LuxR C-terminal-related transcriptional regulator n=1 Tax=Candidatus Agrococcus pullicola TaxID=2838429 RepID=A0A9D1YW57_9MICO|nr:LuxR C-terminal-related transcriptional regulator [Candidatus Agrococcus pullicola]